MSIIGTGLVVGGVYLLSKALKLGQTANTLSNLQFEVKKMAFVKGASLTKMELAIDLSVRNPNSSPTKVQYLYTDILLADGTKIGVVAKGSPDAKYEGFFIEVGESVLRIKVDLSASSFLAFLKNVFSASPTPYIRMQGRTQIEGQNIPFSYDYAINIAEYKAQFAAVYDILKNLG